MSIATLIYVALAVVLLLITDWASRFAEPFGYDFLTIYDTAVESPAFNSLFRILTPLVFVTIVAAAMHVLGQERLVGGLWQVIPLSYGLRWAIALSMQRRRLINWLAQIASATLTSLASWYICTRFLLVRDYVLPDPSNVSNELWLAILLFLYHAYNQRPHSESKAHRRRREHVNATFDRLRGEYGEIVSSVIGDDRILNAIVYAVLLAEDYNRPPPVQWLERWILGPIGLAKSFGPAQVKSPRRLTAEESVRLGTTRLRASYQAYLRSQESAGEQYGWDYVAAMAPRSVATSYNGSEEYGRAIEELADLLLHTVFVEERGTADET